MIITGGTGKIGRLPFVLRGEVNQKLRDHVPAPKIIAWLKKEHSAALDEAGIENLKPQNFSTWRQGGYQAWERQQLRLEEMKAQRELAFEIAQQSDGITQAANLAMATSHIYDALQDFDIRELKIKLREEPELYRILIEGVAKLSRTGVGERKLQLQLTKYQDQVAEQKRKIQAELAPAKRGGLSPETILKIEEALKLM